MPLTSLFKFVNWITGTPHAIEDGVASAFTLALQQQIIDAMNQAPFLASGANHRAGFVPDPGAVAGTSKYLREDATWQTLSSSVYTGSIVNGKITEAHSSNNVTFALKTLAGNDPSSSDPVYASFPDGTYLTITAALSLTITSGNTIGATNATAFNAWIALVNASGTPLLAVRNCSNGSGGDISGFPANGLLTTVSPGSSVFTNYASSVVTTQPYILLGYANYESGLTTAGTWDASPTNMVQCKSGTPYPGMILQDITQLAAGSTLVGSTTLTLVTGSQVAITPMSKVSQIFVWFSGFASATAGGAGVNSEITQQIYRNTTLIGGGVTMGNVSGAGANLQTDGCISIVYVDFPQISTAMTYELRQKCLNVSHSVTSVPFCVVQERLG